ncbi:hypothetical protein Nepgr_024134 [Nepenthes gracilis]|uniref:non-specific serine/threonine protein kinase n=1 Tax=Nepenthes gracilis TaxID=150966 RepID=A0AAD3Y065_NEPGR|nr:hypothetical protein Nepgr_024134 [Nepenthes gracilis]
MHSFSFKIRIWACLFLLSTGPFSLSALSLLFLPAGNIILHGDAYFINNSVSLTQEHLCSSYSSSSSSSSQSPSSSSSYPGVGRALYAYPIRFVNPRTNKTASFSCRFSFSIARSPLCSSGNGIAFFLVSNVELFNQENSHMGLPELASDSQDSFLAVEFDTNLDSSVGDTNGNHVGIDVNSFTSLASVDANSEGINLSNGRHMTAWIEYRDSEKMIRVWVGYYPARPPNPLLHAQIDLSKHLKEFMHIGFSASNGHGSAVHIVDRWRFETFGLLPSRKQMDGMTDDDEGYCFMCSPGETDVAQQPFDSMPNRKGITDMGFIMGGIAWFIFSLIAVAVYVLISCYVKARRSGTIATGQTTTLKLNKVPAKFSLSEIKSATAGFRKDRIVGEGASAIVYLGILPDGKQVAVKRFKCVSRIDEYINPFTSELNAMARCLRHRNLVQLLGWCCEHRELVLISDYLPNGSLSKILHESSDSVNVLAWEHRMNIIMGIAAALIYLHEGCDRQIIHRDVKTSNIMLDADLTAKLGDVCLAELYEHSSLPREATIPAGTMGYLAPEYVYSGVPSVKTDVYSFGVVILEVASGRSPIDDDGIVIGSWAWGLWEKGKLKEIIDPRLKGRYSRVEMDRMLKVGLCCVHPHCEKRPTIKEAARMLRGGEQLPELPLRKPKVKLGSLLPMYSDEMLSFVGDENHAFDNTPWLTPRTHF